MMRVPSFQPMVSWDGDRDPEGLAKRHVVRARREKRVWMVLLVPLTAAVVVLPERVSLAMVTFLSIYALVISARSVERGGDAEVAGRENP